MCVERLNRREDRRVTRELLILPGTGGGKMGERIEPARAARNSIRAFTSVCPETRCTSSCARMSVRSSASKRVSKSAGRTSLGRSTPTSAGPTDGSAARRRVDTMDRDEQRPCSKQPDRDEHFGEKRDATSGFATASADCLLPSRSLNGGRG